MRLRGHAGMVSMGAIGKNELADILTGDPSCGAEFTYQPDSDWVTIVLPGMRSVIEE